MRLAVRSRRTRLVACCAVVAVTLVALSGCATTPRVTTTGGRIAVVAAENFWGSLATQLGGRHVVVRSVITNPDADPHDYEPTAGDARAIAHARVVIVNGVGYDEWATKLAAANPSPARTLLTVGDIVGARPDDNPHRWYNPLDVQHMIDIITATYQAADPADARYFDARHRTVIDVDLKDYFGLITQIRDTYPGTPVGASESIVAMLAPALRLDLITPPSFLTAISEGGEPTAADKSTIDAQITSRAIRVYVYNSQNATPDVRSQVAEARAAGIPVTSITETLTPAGASFQSWQVAQLTALRAALAQATGK